MDLASVIGWIPAIVFPTATALQLAAIVRARSAKGVSIAGWLLFGVANLSLYIYVERYGELQAILSGLGTAVLNFAIVVVALAIERGSPPAARS